MGRWTDVAAWAGPIPNCGPGRMTSHAGVVIHTAEGSYDGTIAWQRNPAAEVGSHFVTAQDGRVAQLVDTDTRSWCQSAGNDTWISIENAGYGSRGESLSAGQVEACAKILARAHREYGVPLQVSNSPGTPGLGWHGMGGASWGGHTGCPGNAIKAQLPAIVARAAAIVGGDDMALDSKEREWLATCVEILGAMATGDDHTWSRPVKAQAQLNAISTEVQALAARPASPVTMTDADRDDIAARTATKLSATVAQAVADEVAKRLGNG